MLRSMGAYAFIDGQNLHRGIERQGWKIDDLRFRRYLTEKFRVTRAFYFLGYLASNERLYAHLRRAGFELVFKPVTKHHDGVKGNCDAELVLHAMMHFQSYDAAVIVSGDGDFRCLIEHLASAGKLGVVLIPDAKSFSALLKPFADKLRFLGGLQAKIGRRN